MFDLPDLSLFLKVSSDRDALEELAARTGWTPGRAATRPSEESVLDKAQLLENAMRRYRDVASYVLHRVFKLSASSTGGFASSILFVSEETLKEARRTKEGSAANYESNLFLGLTTFAERESGSRPREVVFNDNLFPYMLPEGTHHSVLWLLLDQDESDEHHHISDEEISQYLEKELASPDIEYVWYRNPKPTVQDNITFHVQVFWRRSS